MRQRCIPPPGSERERQLSFRPPDPADAPALALAEARAALKRYDPFLDLWWSPVIRMGDPTGLIGRWTIKCWQQHDGAWETVCIWEGPNGEFRNELPTDSLVEEVAKRDRWRRIETASETWQRRIERMHAENAAIDEKREMTHRAETWREAADKAFYQSGIRKNIATSNAQGRFEARQKRLRRKHRT